MYTPAPCVTKVAITDKRSEKVFGNKQVDLGRLLAVWCVRDGDREREEVKCAYENGVVRLDRDVLNRQ